VGEEVNGGKLGGESGKLMSGGRGEVGNSSAG
jgi:hypothetical protein